MKQKYKFINGKIETVSKQESFMRITLSCIFPARKPLILLAIFSMVIVELAKNFLLLMNFLPNVCYF
jgi:hypothetical protein